MRVVPTTFVPVQLLPPPPLAPVVVKGMKTQLRRGRDDGHVELAGGVGG